MKDCDVCVWCVDCFVYFDVCCIGEVYLFVFVVVGVYKFF